jgi:type IV secretion system protein VirB6/type IV secretion system protein TrbL
MLAAGLASAGGGAQAVMAAFSKAHENVQSGSDVLTRLWGGGSGGGAPTGGGGGQQAAATGARGGAGKGGSSSGGPSTPASSGGFLSAAAQAATTPVKIAADAGANLVAGAAAVAKEGATSLIDAAKERMAETTGGKIATAIQAMGHHDTPTFTENSLAGDRPADPEAEVAAFVNRESDRTSA